MRRGASDMATRAEALAWAGVGRRRQQLPPTPHEEEAEGGSHSWGRLVWFGGEADEPFALYSGSQVSAEPNSADSKYPGIIESTEEYKFVERLVPPTQVPVPPKHDRYPTPSGWRPPQDSPPAFPYFVGRSRMHNIPVYCRRNMTVIGKVEDDIWAFGNDVKEYLMQLYGQMPSIQVNKGSCSIRIKGHFDLELKMWLMDKGF